MTKKRILFVGEGSPLSTGFSTYYRELIPRLVALNKYDIAEIGSYCRTHDPKVTSFVQDRWKFYGALPNSQEEAIEFNKPSTHPADNGANINQFGYGIFDKVCAEFKPDIVIAVRDFWMDSPALRSPFRPWFKFLWMACCDAIPQAEEWISAYEQCDLMMAYSDFGVDTLKKQSKKIKLFPKPMRPGVDLNIFKPMDRKIVRDEFALNADIPIIGSVMRNQSRKLYLDLIDSFALMKNKYKGVSEVDKSVLLLHTIWPDNAYSFNYPRHIMRLQAYPWMPNYFKGIKDNVLQTLMCHNCGKKSVTFAMNLYGRPITDGAVRLACMWCGQNTATGPTTGVGFEREELAQIYNLMDLYVQCSNCEGDGMPIQEAKACGVPTIVTDYSAMSEKGRLPIEYSHVDIKNYSVHLGGDVIKIKNMRHEPETGCLRAMPDIEDLADKMHYYLTEHSVRNTKSADARKCVENNYDWNELYKQWEYVLDNVQSKDRTKTWESKIEISTNDLDISSIPIGLSDEKFIEWLYLSVLKYNAVDPVGAKMWIAHLQNGITREVLFNQFLNIANNQTALETQRAKLLGIQNTKIISNSQEWL